MSLSELKQVITEAGLSYADCIEKGDFRKLAQQALGGDTGKVTLGETVVAENQADETKPFDEPEKQQLEQGAARSRAQRTRRREQRTAPARVTSWTLTRVLK